MSRNQSSAPGQTAEIESKVAGAQPSIGSPSAASGDNATGAPRAPSNAPPAAQPPDQGAPGRSSVGTSSTLANQGDTQVSEGAGRRSEQVPGHEPTREKKVPSAGVQPTFVPGGTQLKTSHNGKPDVVLNDDGTVPNELPGGKLGYMPTPIHDPSRPHEPNVHNPDPGGNQPLRTSADRSSQR